MKKPAAGFILAALLCVGFSAARAYDPNKPWIYSMRFMMDTWGYLEMYSTATVVSKPSNFAAFRVVTSTTNPTYQLVVTTQGYVGIATANPAGILTVGDGSLTVTPAGLVGVGAAAPIRTLHVNGELSLSRSDRIGFINISDINGNSGGTLWLRGLDQNGTVGSTATVLVNGNVGIGTASPSTALQVNGTVTATAFSGDGSAPSNLPVAKVASVSFSGNSATITGLSPGKIYRLVAALTQQTSPSTHYLRINGDSDAHYSWANYAWAASGPANNCAAGQPAFMLTGNGDGVNANNFIYLEMEFTTWGGGGVNMQYIGKASWINGGGNQEAAVISGIYGGASTALSSITYYCTAGTMSGVLILYQLN